MNTNITTVSEQLLSNLLWCLRIFSVETCQLMNGNRILYQSHGRKKHKYGNVVILSINAAFLHVSFCVQEYFFLSKVWKCHRFENLHKQKCLFICTYIYIYIHTHTHTYIYMYVWKLYLLMCTSALFYHRCQQSVSEELLLLMSYYITWTTGNAKILLNVLMTIVYTSFSL